jgi:hypothetical protein
MHPSTCAITYVRQLPDTALEILFAPAYLRLQWVADGGPIPGSYWGEPEAGLIGDSLLLRPDTPVHSALHEAAHWLCLPRTRHAALHTDAASGDREECAVCLLQCLLADGLAGYSRAMLFRDMDAWGYHFRHGSAQAWFEHDADDARTWLRECRAEEYPSLHAVIQSSASIQAEFRKLWQNDFR